MPRLLIAALIAVATSGCGILYKQPIYQGNLVEPDAVAQLQAGMDKQQVLTLLGTPSISDPFHQDRWDYTATRRTDRVGRTHVKNLTLWFDGESLARWEGDYFPEDAKALANEVQRFGPNLPRDKGGRRGRR